MLRPIYALIILCAPCLGSFTAFGQKPDFNRDIRPILSENCFHCHGPDAEAREAELRLDTYEGATEGGEFDIPVVPGKPEKSELVTRIFSDDPKELMPPPKSKRSLTAKQKQLLRDWVASGAEYEDHWAWIAPARPEPPTVRHKEDVSNPIDAFLLRRLESEGLGYSSPTGPATLLRRVSLDLIGLPPTPEEAATFQTAWAADPQATLEAAVNRLLASPRFGERWARPWLDLARYADSNGFQADQLRPSWPYRDWVIDALNANMPYDQFTIEQLAGDLLPNATIAQKVATGFHRTVTCNVEAGVHPEENRYNQVVDRVNTTGTTWLGITMECSQCHDHKYDPFSMKDYYSLFAYFNNTPLEVSLPSGKNDVSHDFVGPYLDLPLAPKDQQQAKLLDQKIAAAKTTRENLLHNSESGFPAWEQAARKALTKAPQWKPVSVNAFRLTNNAQHKILKDGTVLITGNLPSTDRYVVEAQIDLQNVTGFKIEILPDSGPNARAPSKFVLQEFEVELRQGKKKTSIELFNPMTDISQKGWDVAGIIDGKPKTGWSTGAKVSNPHWATVNVTEPIKVDSKTSFLFRLSQTIGRNQTIGSFRISAISDPNGIASLPKPIATILQKLDSKRSKKERAQLHAHFTKSNKEIKAVDLQIVRLQKQRASITPTKTLVMVEMDKPRPTHITNRGNYLDPRDQVGPNTPKLFPKLTAPNKSANRLELAQWLVSRDNPLTARVAANRWWAELFGNGIVATLEDFGTQSDPPTHPELLDWLAVEFMDSGWDMKHTLKTIVLSKAYRQSSRLTPELQKKDPRNFLLGRAPRFRMDSERVRDNALAVSGLLSTKMHGPPIMPYQPSGVWRQVGRNEPKWVENKNEQRWRRGVYIVYRRAAPYPSMVNFDAPDRGACTVKRPRTNTPLQALTMLNDPAYIEMALALANRILTEASTPDERLARAFQLVVSRPPAPEETTIINKLLQERLTHFQTDPKATQALLSNPTVFYKPTHPDKAELAAWFYVATTLLNLDETMTKP